MEVFIMAVPNLGSFSQGDPQAQAAVQAAIQARRQGSQPVPQLGQQGAQGGQPSVPQPTPAPQGAPPQLPTQGQEKPPSTEAELIVKGLSSRLSAISKVETSQTETRSAPVV